MRRRVGKGLLPLCIGEADPALQQVGAAGGALARTLHRHAHPDTVQSPRVQRTIRLLRGHFAAVFAS